MRTTITLDPEAKALVEKAMREQKRSFKEIVNEAIIRGLGGQQAGPPVQLPVHDMGKPFINLDKALQIAGELEDEEILRKMALGK
jgi:hypothetical protein